MKVRSCGHFLASAKPVKSVQERAFNCAGTAFVQGDSAGDSKLIEQTLA